MFEALRVEQLSVRRSERQVLQDVSFDAQYGALLAIAGPNGAGKSSLLRALLGLLPSSGTILVNQQPAAALTPTSRARTLAYVPQQAPSLAFVAVQDVVAQARYAHLARWGRIDPSDAAVTRALALTELQPLARRAFDTLSGGEQRRVLLARALASEARILILDEPTAGLDVGQVLRFYALARRLTAQGHALVCVLHDLADVHRYADRVLLLDRGRSAAFGAAPEVLDQQRLAAVYGVQLHERAAPGFSLDGAW